MVDREIKPDDATVAPPDHGHLGHVQIVEQRQVVAGHEVVGQPGVGHGGAPVAAAVRHNDLVMGRKPRDLGRPDIRVAQSTVDEQDGRPVLIDGVVTSRCR